MDQAHAIEQLCQALLVTLFRMCRDTRQEQQDISDLARRIQLDYGAAKKLIGAMEQQGLLETLTFGQKVAFTDAGFVVAQRLLHS